MNPLAGLTNDELWNCQLWVAVLCTRKPFATRKDRTAALCAVGHAFQLEATARGLSSPSAPYHVAQLKPNVA